MEKTRNCLWCGNEFVATHFNKQYCDVECRDMAEKERKKREYEARAAWKINRKEPDVTIDMMVDAMARLSKERGKYVSYGQVQKELLTGKLMVEGGVIV